VPSSEDDVLDPYRQPRPVHRASLAQILPAVEEIAQVAIGAASAERPTSAEPRGEQGQLRRRAGTD
jgi:hypothetical protein